MDPSPPPEFDTCLGDLYSVAWMENSDIRDLRRETLAQQYHAVKQRTSQDGTVGASPLAACPPTALRVIDR